MPFTRHKWKDAGTEYYKLGNYKISEYDVAELWELMCGEKAIKNFLAKCEKEREGSDQVVPQMKDRQHVIEMVSEMTIDDRTYLAYCSEHSRMCRFWRWDV